jgi:predicted dehydrogenase
VVWSRGSDATKETQHEIRHFVECAQTGKKPLTDGRSALQGLRVIWALYDAEKRGEIADLRGLGFAKD